MSSGGGGGACGGVAAQGGGAAVRERACRCAARAAAAAARLCAAEAHGWHALESCGLALEGGMLEPRKVHVVRAMNEGLVAVKRTVAGQKRTSSRSDVLLAVIYR